MLNSPFQAVRNRPMLRCLSCSYPFGSVEAMDEGCPRCGLGRAPARVERDPEPTRNFADVVMVPPQRRGILGWLRRR